MNGEDAIVFCVGNKSTGVCGYTWLIETHRTSFYIKSTYRPMQTTKVSLHGPDPNHVGKEHFRFDFEDSEAAKKAINAGGGWGAFGQELPLYFSGRPINKRTVHLARFSAEWNMFIRGMQRGPNPTAKASATMNAFLAAPKTGSVTHVDLYLSRVRPYWKNIETRLRREDAGIGPLVNEAGQYLTAIVTHRRAVAEPDPFGDPSAGVPASECVRGIAEGVDTTGLLWICEKMIPRAKVAVAEPPPKSGFKSI